MHLDKGEKFADLNKNRYERDSKLIGDYLNQKEKEKGDLKTNRD